MSTIVYSARNGRVVRNNLSAIPLWIAYSDILPSLDPRADGIPFLIGLWGNRPRPVA